MRFESYRDKGEGSGTSFKDDGQNAIRAGFHAIVKTVALGGYPWIY